MGETPATTVALQLSALAKAQSATQTVSLILDVVSLPENLSNVTRPLAINGSLIGMLEGSENLALRTAFGQITLSLENLHSETLKTLSNVLQATKGISPTIDLFIESGTPPQKVTLSVPEKWAEPIDIPSKPQPLTPQGIEQTPNAKPAVPTLAQGATVTATVLNPEHMIEQPALLKQNTLEQPAQQKPSVPQLLQPEENVTKPAIEAAPNKPHVTTETEEQAQPNKPEPINQAQVQAPVKAKQITLNLHVDAVHENVKPDQVQPQTNATIVAKGTAGQPIIEQDGLMLFVHEPTQLPVGTKLVVRLTPIEQSEAFTRVEVDKTVAALQDLVDAMETSEVLSSKPAPSLHLPSPQSHFAGTVLFFLSALQGGKVEEWLSGFAADKIGKSGKSGLKDKMIEALEGVTAAKATDATVGSWQSFPVPVYNDQVLEMMQLYVHRDGGGSGQDQAEGKAARKTRFIVNVTMSRLGPIQLDGLSQPKKIDLILRSEHELPTSLIQEIRQTAIPALEAIGLVGTIQFQSGRNGWVHIRDASQAKAPHDQTI